MEPSEKQCTGAYFDYFDLLGLQALTWTAQLTMHVLDALGGLIECIPTAPLVGAANGLAFNEATSDPPPRA
jgi:hypothetical protein